MTHSAPAPRHARTAAEYVGLARRLKAWSGLSYRELARRAAQNGDHLASSTLATALRRTSLPAEPLIAAFVRACGCDETTVEQWIEARRRIAVEIVDGPAPPTTPERAAPEQAAPEQAAPEQAAPERAAPERARNEPVEEAAPVRRRHAGWLRVLAAGTVVVTCTAGSVPAVRARAEPPPQARAAAVTDAGVLQPGWYRVHTGGGDRCLAVRGNGARRAVVSHENCRPVSRQRFYFRRSGGYFTVHAAGPECLAVQLNVPANPLRARACSPSDPGQRLVIEVVSGARHSWLPARLRLRSAADTVGWAPAGSAGPHDRARMTAHRADFGFFLTAEE